MHPHSDRTKGWMAKIRAAIAARRSKRNTGTRTKATQSASRGRPGARAGKSAAIAHEAAHKARTEKRAARKHKARARRAESAYKKGGFAGFGKYTGRLKRNQDRKDAQHARQHARRKAKE